MKGKRYEHAKKKKINFKFLIIFIIILLLTSISAFFIYRNSISKEDDETNNKVSKIIEVQTVENATYLEISDLKIETGEGYSSISTTIKNNSSETLTNLKLDLFIYDENNNLVSQLTNPIELLAPDESIDSFGTVNKELSNAYTCIIKKN